MVGLSALNRKLLRDLWHLKGQVLAIALVMACGIATFILAFGALNSLLETRDAYYDRYRFADIFANLKRAPISLTENIRQIPGVAQVYDRVVFGATLDLPGMTEPATGKLISFPDSGQPPLNRLFLKRGRLLEPHESDAILANEPFATAHNLNPGDHLKMVINGHKREMLIVGIVLSPEYIYSIAPGGMLPDNQRCGVFWTGRRALEAAVNMEGAFNDIVLGLTRGADRAEVRRQLDLLLAPYGGLISYGREDQTSNWYVANELEQLRTVGVTIPMIFLGVAAFLLHIVMGRLIAIQRQQIGMLKAIGYSNVEIGFHFVKFVLVIVLTGSLLGVAGGYWTGSGVTAMYARYFYFPLLRYDPSTQVIATAILISTAAAMSGAFAAIRATVTLPPAEAMRPPTPTIFKTTLIERLGLQKSLSQPARMILRHIGRRPFKAALSSLGIAMALAIFIGASFTTDAMKFILDVQFDVAQREDINLTFTEPKNMDALDNVRHLPGVFRAEPVRTVAADLRAGHFSHRGGVTGIASNAELSRMIDDKQRPVALPENGIVLSRTLAEKLHVRAGQKITLDVLEEKRPSVEVQVAAVVDEFIGTSAYMALPALNRLMKEGPVITGAAILLDPLYKNAFFAHVKATPAIAGIAVMAAARQVFEATMAEHIKVMTSFHILFAGLIAFGVVYNTAQIALSERSSELASLRVLGLTKEEIGYILLGELGLLVIMAIPLGMAIGYFLAWWLSQAFTTELYRIPLVVGAPVFANACLVVLASAALSGLAVWHRIETLDLIAVLKTRE
jgi:putative ABC transport system permease protein